MPEYLAPGVYIEEIPGPRAIEGVSTSTAGFVGQTERGPVIPRLCTSWPDYQRWYGGFIDSAISFLPFAIKGFFDNGGQRAFVARVHGENAIPSSLALDNLQVNATGAGEWGNRVFVRVQPPGRPDPDRFRLLILYYTEPPPLPLVDPFDPANIADPNRREPNAVEDYDDLGFDPQGANYVLTTVNGASQLIEVEWLDPTAPARPADGDYAPLASGTNGDPINETRYIGDASVPTDERTGLAGLEVIDEISLLCVPDEVHPTLPPAAQDLVMNAIVNQCELLKDRFAVLQIGRGNGNVNAVDPPRDTNYAAVYYPWIRIYDTRTRSDLLVPPGGHVTGIIARTDIERGVHKPPANAVVRGIINRDLNGNRKPVEFKIVKGQHDILNPKGINVIRDFRADGRGIRVWGARTMSSDPEWKYVNVRRLFIFVEESIDEGTQWVVFEPNHEPTWAAVSRTITNFLLSVWRSGALMGTTQDEAFFVKCDRTTMSQDDIDNGRLICYIGIAPVKPAEFVIFRFSQKTVEATG